MAEFTLLEIHLEDATLTANAPFGRGETSDDAPGTDRGDGAGTGGDEGDGGSGSRRLALVAGLVVLAVLAVVLRRLIGGADTEIGPDDAVTDGD